MPVARVLLTSEAPVGLLAQIRRLLDEAFDGDFSEDDWEHTLGGWHVMIMDGGVPVAHAAAVPRTLAVANRRCRTGYVEGVATSAERQGEGLGSHVMSRLADALRREFELGALSTGHHAFYERLGWERWRGPTFVRSSQGLIRSGAEDDGLMVLRYGSSADLDLTDPISCEARAGDDW